MRGTRPRKYDKEKEVSGKIYNLKQSCLRFMLFCSIPLTKSRKKNKNFLFYLLSLLPSTFVAERAILELTEHITYDTICISE